MRLSLATLLQRAIMDPSAEPALLRALLGVTLFVHRPLSDDYDRLRLVQFTRPDGVDVIPVFTDAAKAHVAAQGHVAVFGMQGRILFEATRGATLMVNPNDTSCTLYPEEIADLLDGRRIARAPAASHVAGVAIELAPPAEHWIGELASEALATIPSASSLYQFHGRTQDDAAAITTLLVIGVQDRWAERAARAISARLEPVINRSGRSLDMTSFDPAEPVPNWLAPFVSDALWRRDGLH